MAIVVTSTNGHRSRVCELNGNGRDTEALCRHLFSLAKAALKSVACFVVVYISSAAIWMGRGTSTYQHQKADRKKNSNLIVLCSCSSAFPFVPKTSSVSSVDESGIYQAEIVRVQLILCMSRESGSRRSNKGGRQSQ